MLLTGGGPEIKKPSDPVLESIEVAAPHMDVTIDNSYDSTAVFEAGKVLYDRLYKIKLSIKNVSLKITFFLFQTTQKQKMAV